MKRTRNFVQCCTCCKIQFESNASFTRHCNTKSHKHKQLGFQNAMVMAMDEDREDSMMISRAAEPPYIPPPDFFNRDILDEDQESVIGEEMETISDELAEDGEGPTAQAEQTAQPNNFFPFPDEKFFLLYCYAHGIMRPKSRVDLEFLWMMLSRFGANPPSLDSVLSYKLEGLDDMLQLKKSYGNDHPFYWIAPSDLIKMQLATPLIAQKLARYPERTQHIIEEMCQGRTWHISEQFHTTSATVNNITVYIGDVVQYKSREHGISYGKIQNFFSKKVDNCLKFMCDVIKVHTFPTRPESWVITDEIEEIELNCIGDIMSVALTFKETNGQIVPLTQKEITMHQNPHPTKRLAGDKETLTLPIVIFSDETSGNRSKKWNRLETYSFFLAGLPRKDVTKFSNINFICASNLVDSITMGKVIATDLAKLEEGIVMYDALTKKDVFVQCPILCVVCDNPRASEITHHLGSSAIHFCRTCDATKENAIEIGDIRTDEGTRTTVSTIINARSERQKKLLRKETGVTERGGQFDELKTFSAIEQTPVEILHTILLGAEKYLLAKTMKGLSPADKKKVKARIEVFDFSAFPGKVASSITTMYGSYVGRDFKLWAQIAVFILMDIVTEEELQVWRNLSEVFSISYASHVDTRDYGKIMAIISSLLDSMEEVHPDIMRKPKLHTLVHLMEDMSNFGPAVGFATERFESFNSVIRQMNLSTNRQACSRDIGKLYAKHQILKYVINGGSWGDNHRKCASSQLQCLAKNAKLLKFMYQDNVREQSEKEIYQPGSLRLGQYKKGHLQKFDVGSCLNTSAIENDMKSVARSSKCNYFKGCISKQHELVRMGQAITYKDGEGQDCFGEFDGAVKLLNPSSETSHVNWIQVKQYACHEDENGQVQSGRFDSPLLKKTDNIVIIKSSEVCHKVNIVHNCINGHCKFEDAHHTFVEEREGVVRDALIYKHDFANNTYLLNRFYLGNDFEAVLQTF